MANFEYVCPGCETALAKWDYQAPIDHYRCYVCGLSTPFIQLPKRSLLKTWTPVGQFGRRPITVTFKGSTTDISGATSLTIPNVSVGAGDLLLCASMTDGTVTQGFEYLRFNLTWGSVTGFSSSGWQQYEFHTDPLPNVNLSMDGSAFLITSAQTNDVVVDYSFSVPSNTKVAAAFTVSGLTNQTPTPNDFWYFLNQSNTFGTSTTPACTPVLIRKAESAVIAAFGIAGPDSDTAGAYQNSFSRITRIGTSGGSPDITMDLGYIVTDAIQTITGAMSGMTSRSWLAVPTIFDRT